MKTVIRQLKWHPVSKLPEGDCYLVLVAMEEENVNYTFHKRLHSMGKYPKPIKVLKTVQAAIFDIEGDKFMIHGLDVTSVVKRWALPEYPEVV